MELEAACATLAASLAAVTKVEQQAAAFFTLPEAARDPADYVGAILIIHMLITPGNFHNNRNTSYHHMTSDATT